MIYGQEVFFSAPETYLQRLQSLDSKPIKLVLKVPIHTQTLKAYNLAGIMPLNEWRKLACAKYIIRASATSNSTVNELFFRSDLSFSKRAQNISSLQSIATFTKDLIEPVLEDIALLPKDVSSPTPLWELENAHFDVHYSNIKKSEMLN